MIEVIDDFIPKYYQKSIKQMVLNDTMPFLITDITSRDTDTFHTKKQFVHSLYVGPLKNRQDRNGNMVEGISEEYRSSYWNRFMQMFNNIPEFKTHNLLRSKINITLPYKTRYNIEPHTDSIQSDAISYLYYVSDSDGPTVVWDRRGKENDIVDPPWWWKKTKINPKQGRIVRFPSDHLHSGNMPHKYSERIVLNFVFSPR